MKINLVVYLDIYFHQNQIQNIYQYQLQNLIKETDSDYITDEFGNKFPKYEEKEDDPYKQETRGRKPKNKARDKYEENLSKEDYEELQRLEEIIGKSKGKKTKHPLYKKVKELKTKAYNKIK